MDGIYGVVPYAGAIYEIEDEDTHQMSLFELMGMAEIEPKPVEKRPEAIDCKIYNWRENKSVIYKSMKEG